MLLVEGTAEGATRLPPSFGHDSVVSQIQNRGTIRIGVIGDAPGFSSFNPTSGRYTGLDIAVSRRLTQSIFGSTPMNAEDHIEFVPLSLCDRVPSLVDNRVDAVVSVFSVTKERQRLIDFTMPYFGAPLVMVVRDDSPIVDVTDLRKSTVALVASTVEADLVRRGQLANKVMEFSSNDDTVQAVRDGRADAVLMCRTLFDGFEKQPGHNLKALPSSLEHYSFAIGVRKGEDEFRKFLNREVQDMVTSGFIAAADAHRRRSAG